MAERIKKMNPILLLVIGMFVSLIGQIMFSAFTSREEILNSSVTQEYVDLKDKEIITAFRQGDKQVKEDCMEESNDIRNDYERADNNIKENSKDKFDILLQEIRLNRKAINKK